ncbi:uncharacterized protein LOC120344825 isoform X2 [Styela clava]
MQNNIQGKENDGTIPKPRKLWIDSTPFTPEGYENESSVLVESSPPRVKLIHFSTKPIVDFGTVKTGKTVTRKLVVENPNYYEVEVSVEKFPWKKNFSIDQETFNVEEEGINYVEITWTPTQSGNCRELVMMKYDSGFRVHVLIIGHAESPKKKVKTRTRRGAAAKKLPRRSIKNDLSKLSSMNDTENIDPQKSICSQTSSSQDSVLVSQSSPSSNKTKCLQKNDDVTLPVLEEKQDFSNLRNALLPFHVVSDNPRDSCGSITAPTSPSGLDAPVIEHHSLAPSPLARDKSVVSKSTDHHPEPHQITYNIDSSIAGNSIGPSSPFKQQETTGRPTYILPAANQTRQILNPLLSTPFTPSNNQKLDEKTEVNMLDYALSVIKRPTTAKPENFEVENNSSPEDDSLEDIKSCFTEVNPSTHDIPDIEITEDNPTDVNITSNLQSDEITERLSSTQALDRTSHDGAVGLPVPDISVISLHSPMKSRKRKSPKLSPSLNKRRSMAVGMSRRPSLSSNCTDTTVTKPSGTRVRRNSGAYGTPKGRALQRFRAARASETMPIHKASGTSAKKRRSSVNKVPKQIKQDKSSSQHLTKRSLSSSVNEAQKIAMKRLKMKAPITRLVLKPSNKTLTQTPESSTMVVRMPFASGNMYYDEKWRKKQEHAYMTWLNYILTPDEFKSDLESKDNTLSSSKGKNKTLQHSDIFTHNIDKSVPAPSKETASLRVFRIRSRLDRLRRSACQLFQSESMINVVRKVEEAVESGHVKLRDDKRLWADVGNKTLVLDLILSFHPLWLRVCLEVVFGEILPIHANTDIVGLGKFVLKKLLNCTLIAEEFAHPTVPHSFKPGYKEKISKHTLKKFLILIYFLDQAKQKRLIDHDPCLFRKESKFRNCRDILHSFSRDLLKGEGDIVKHLGYLGYKVNYNQTFIDEFEFGIKNIAIDLRDGVRLVRIVELLFHQHDLTPKLRVPATSLFQKKHNVAIALKALEFHGVSMNDGAGKKIESDHVVRGHCEMTLALLWNIASYFQLEKGVNKVQLRDEIEYLKKNLRLKHMMEKTRNFYEEQDQFLSRVSKSDDNTFLLLEWCRLVCALKSIPVHNFGASFSDGRVLACLISYYQSNLIAPSQIFMKTMQSRSDPDPMLDDSAFVQSMVIEEEIDRAQLMKNEKSNLKLVQNAAYEIGGIPNLLRMDDICNTIPDDKVVKLLVSFLCTRLLDISIEDKAARTIQIAWRAYMYRKRVLEEMRLAEEERFKRNRAASIIQAYYKRYKQRKQFKQYKDATLIIQRIWRMKKMIHPQRKEFLKLKSAVILIQSLYRAKKANKLVEQLKKEQIERIAAASKIQHYWRGALMRKDYLKKKKNAIIIQNWFRNLRAARSQRSEYLAYKSAVMKVQIQWRATLEMRKQVAIYSTKREAAILIQNVFRQYAANKRVNAVVCIQRKWRAILLMREFRSQYLLQKSATIKIQCAVKCFLARKTLERVRKQQKAAFIIQAYWKAYLLMKNERNRYIAIRKATIVIQCSWRCFLAKRKVEKIRKIQSAASLIQTRWRARILMKKEKSIFALKKSSAVKVQCAWRCYLAKKAANEKRKRLSATRVIQIRWKATLLMKKQKKEYDTKLRSIILMQSCLRSCLAKTKVKFLRKRISSAMIIQQIWRSIIQMRKERQNYVIMKKSAIKMQCFFRGFLARTKTTELRKQHKAAVVIQRQWKAYIAMKKQKKNFGEIKDATILLQCAWRRILANRRATLLRKRLSASIVIQKHWKATLEMRNVRKHYLEKKKAAIVIQCALRCFMARIKLVHMRKKYSAILYIQQKWKSTILMRSERKEFVQKITAAIVIQCSLRCYVARNELMKLRKRQNATLVLQKKWRATLLMKREKERYTEKKKAVVTIQCTWRVFAAKTELETLRCRHNAAIVIQRKWRATLQMREEKLEYLRIKNSVITIQCFWRCLVAKRILKRRMQAVCVIQKKWKATIEMRIERNSFLTLKRSAISIQCARRCVLAKRKVSSLRKELKATQTIQAKWRATLCMRKLRREFLCKKEATTVLQCALRCYVARKKYKELCERKNAVLVIQRRWRATVLMIKQKKEYVLKKRSAIDIQCFWRCYLAKTQLSELRKRYNAVVLLQQKWSATLLMKKERNEFMKKRNAIVIIQSLWRRILAQKIFARKKKLLISVNIIQVKWRATMAMKEQKMLFVEMKKSAIIIQCFYRCVLAKRVLKELRNRNNAAKIIQERWQGSVKMKKERSVFLNKKNAAISIQGFWRVYIAKKELAKLRRRSKAASVIQNWWKAKISMIKEKRRFSAMKNAASVIQRSWRCFSAKKTLHVLRKQLYYAKVIQKRWKATLDMRELKRKYIEMKTATLTIQCWWRRVLAIQERARLVRRYNAAVVIQRKWRATLCMKDVKNGFLKMKSAAIVIQCSWRCYVARLERKKRFILFKAVVIIQEKWKATLIKNKQRKAFCDKKAAAITIQCNWRRVLASRKVDSMRNELSAAKFIQQKWRATLAMRKVRKEFIEKKQAAIIIQTIFRSILAKRKVLNMRKQRIAACYIQAKWRATLMMRADKISFIEKRQAVVAIQSIWRSVLARRQLALMRKQWNAGSVIQHKWKATRLMKQYRKQFIEMKMAALTIQCFWRCFLAKKELSALQYKMKKVLIIQNRWRAIIHMKKQRKEFLGIKKAVLVIQNAWRNFIVKKEDGKILSAALVIQRRWRANKYMKTTRSVYTKKKRCAIIIQRAWRQHLASRRAVQIQKQIEAARTIQQIWRTKTLMKEARENFLAKQLSAVIIQSAWRCHFSKRRYIVMKQSVKVIQAKWRATVEMRKTRDEFIRMKKATICIQSFWRGYMAKVKEAQMKKVLDAVKIIQTRWKSTLLMKKERREYLRQQTAAVVIQNHFRCLYAKGQLTKMQKRRNAVLLIQRIWKSVLLRNRERNEFLKKRKAAIKLQCAFRSFVAKRTVDDLRKKNHAAIILQSKWRYIALMKREMRNFHLKKEAILTIQRVYRGYLVRKSITNNKVLRVRRKCELAFHHARNNPNRKISNRMDSVLSTLLDSKAYDQVYATLEDIYSLSHLLPYCCERISNAGGIEVLCELIGNSNRSIHAAFVYKFSINILLNLVQNPSTRHNTCRIMATTDPKHDSAPVELLVNLLPRFRDKSGRDPVQLLVFSATCSVLIEFCRDERNIEILKSKSKSVDMIRYVNKEMMIKMKTKAHRTEECRRKRQRDTTGYLSLSSTISEPHTSSGQHNFLDVSTRETSFICNMEMKRSSTPKSKQNKKNAENCDPSKQPARNLSTKKIVSNLFGSEGISAAPPKVRQTLLTQRTAWNTNVPFHRSRKVTKPQSPKFQGARLKKIAGMQKIKAIHPISEAGQSSVIGKDENPSKEVIEPTNLKSIAYDDSDPLSCINTLIELLT